MLTPASARVGPDQNPMTSLEQKCVVTARLCPIVRVDGYHVAAFPGVPMAANYTRQMCLLLAKTILLPYLELYRDSRLPVSQKNRREVCCT